MAKDITITKDVCFFKLIYIILQAGTRNNAAVIVIVLLTPPLLTTRHHPLSPLLLAPPLTPQISGPKRFMKSHFPLSINKPLQDHPITQNIISDNFLQKIILGQNRPKVGI